MPAQPLTDERGTFDARARDARDLRRGFVANLSGYAARLSLPVLNLLVIRQYGAELFGEFAIAQASLVGVWRFGSLGLDKAALWWVPRRQDASHALWSMLFWIVLANGLLAALIVAFLAPALAEWSGARGSVLALRWMALGLVPTAILELTIHAVMGARNMAVRAFVRDGFVPALQVITALGASLLGWRQVGLPLSFVVSVAAGALVASWMARGSFGPVGSLASLWRLPLPVLRYAGPIWLSELLSTLVGRLDVYALARLSDARSVGIYAAASQLAGSLRAVRQSFDPIVLSLCSELSARGDRARLVAGFSRATAMVVLIQVPLWAAIFCFDEWLMRLFGADFSAGANALWILASCWALNGVLGLNGIVLLGYGRSGWTLLGLLLTSLVMWGALSGCIPRWGLAGAALAVTLAYTLLSAGLAWLAYHVARTPLYDRGVQRLLGLASLGVVCMLGAWFALGSSGGALQRAGAFSVFLLVSGLAYARWRGQRRGAA
ncbi:MAG TPA: oligosaccharide flippase family protein [Polyangiaceae bacterium]|nr:oligosaccharide flippase family protein [Polyangiaceae bacterium]